MAAAHHPYPEGVQANGNRRCVPLGKRGFVALHKPGVLIGRRTRYVFQRSAAGSLAERAYRFLEAACARGDYSDLLCPGWINEPFTL